MLQRSVLKAGFGGTEIKAVMEREREKQKICSGEIITGQNSVWRGNLSRECRKVCHGQRKEKISRVTACALLIFTGELF